MIDILLQKVLYELKISLIKMGHLYFDPMLRKNIR